MPARLCADPAVLVVTRVPLALLTARPASLGARLHDRPGKLGFELGLPTEDASRRGTEIAAVLAQANAADQHPDVVLTEARIGTGRTALRAIEAGLDAFHERTGRNSAPPWMRLQQLLCVSHHRLPPVGMALAPKLPSTRRVENRPAARLRRLKLYEYEAAA